MPTVPVDKNTIEAMPSKEFFVYMLTRDIELVDAIADLFDNCVDGARRIHPNGPFKGLWVRIEATADKFRIADNCGGISVDLARHYAFRFGRPPNMPETKHSVGEFGIGMKRALFKLGRNFTIESATMNSRFSVRIDVDEWQRQQDWNFRFATVDENISVPAERRGTTLTVSKLYEGVASEFRLENYRNMVRERLEAKHQSSLSEGLSVSFNKSPLKFAPAELLQSSNVLRPGYFEKEYLQETGTPVNVQIWVGVSDSDPTEGGWYVYCNGRLVLEADKSRTTGWGEDEVVSIPRYHNQFARFRGYAMFDCDDAGLLPWNTSKTDVALDSPLYQTVRQQMVFLMRPVINFLNDLRQEEKQAEDSGENPLAKAIDRAKSVDIQKVAVSPTFISPKTARARVISDEGRIQYSRPLDQISRVQRALKATSRKEVGEKTFDYFLKAECKD